MEETVNKIFLKTIFALAVCFSVIIHASAQTDQQTPAAVAKANIEASIKSDWAKCAALMHPEALKFVRTFADKIAEKDNDTKKEIERTFGVSRAEYPKLSDEQVYAKLVASYLKDKMVGEMLEKTTYTMLGQVAEGTDLTHVIFRLQTNAEKANDKTFLLLNMSYSVADIMSLKRNGDRWGLMLSPTFEAMITSTLATMAMFDEWIKAEEHKKAESPSPPEPEANAAPTKPLPKKVVAPRQPLKKKP
jgi:hypothetical protein